MSATATIAPAPEVEAPDADERYLPESKLTVDEQCKVLQHQQHNALVIECVARSYYEINLSIVDADMVVRRLDLAPPLRSQIVAELRRVAKLYEWVADGVEEDGLHDGDEITWLVDEDDNLVEDADLTESA